MRFFQRTFEVIFQVEILFYFLLICEENFNFSICDRTLTVLNEIIPKFFDYSMPLKYSNYGSYYV